MSKNTKHTISFNKKVFNNYTEVVDVIKEFLEIQLKEDISSKNENIKIFSTMKSFLVKGLNCEIYDQFVKKNIAQLLIDVLKNYLRGDDVELLRSILSYIITITDNSEIMCGEFVEGGLPSILINTTIKVCGESYKEKLPKSISVEDIVAQLILIIHNIARDSKFQQAFIQYENSKIMKQKIRKYLGSKDKRMCILTMAVLTWLAEDDRKDELILSLHEDIIGKFTEYVNKGMKDSGRWYEGLNVWELLSVLQALSGMSCISQSCFLKSQFVNTLINVIKSKTSLPNELLISIGILWNISFHSNSKERLKKEFHIDDVIKTLVYNDNEKVQEKALQVLSIFHEGRKEEVRVNKESKYDIFVSYCHAQSAIIMQLVAELKKKYRVWVDMEGIKGNGLSDMADGIEQSKAVIMAVSTSYKQSQCCRSEANFAFALKKPIIPLLTEYKYKADGWLGLIISKDTYIDVSNIEKINKSLEEIEKHFCHKCNVSVGSDHSHNGEP